MMNPAGQPGGMAAAADGGGNAAGGSPGVSFSLAAAASGAAVGRSVRNRTISGPKMSAPGPKMMRIQGRRATIGWLRVVRRVWSPWRVGGWVVGGMAGVIGWAITGPRGCFPRPAAGGGSASAAAAVRWGDTGTRQGRMKVGGAKRTVRIILPVVLSRTPVIFDFVSSSTGIRTCSTAAAAPSSRAAMTLETRHAVWLVHCQRMPPKAPRKSPQSKRHEAPQPSRLRWMKPARPTRRLDKSGSVTYAKVSPRPDFRIQGV